MLLSAAYFAEGLGDIIVGTFLVAAVAGAGGGLSTAGSSLWILVGVAAAPATVLWHRVARRVGADRALVAALVVQCLAITAPALDR